MDEILTWQFMDADQKESVLNQCSARGKELVSS
jgi:predicted Fe-S protein YdhL (DUF1289 family)